MKKTKVVENPEVVEKTKNMYVMGLGAVATGGATLLGLGELTLQKLKSAQKLKSTIQEKNVIKGTKTSIWFSSIQSVDDMINKLERLKSAMGTSSSGMKVSIVKRKKNEKIHG